MKSVMHWDQILSLANYESQNLGHNFIGTEHVLCVLIGIPEIAALGPLKEREISLEIVRAQVLDGDGIGSHKTYSCFSVGIVPPQRHSCYSSRRPLTPRLRRILDVCKTNTPHKDLPPVKAMLLGIIDEGDGVAVRVLKSLRIDFRLLRETLIEDEASTKSLQATRGGARSFASRFAS